MSTNSIHFKGLTKIRAVAALGVLIHHIELYKFREGRSSLYDTQLKYFIDNLGRNCVLLFFVLSGFLITYLLLNEKKTFNKINIKKFYMRRILRIWPLYYLVILLSFTLIPFLVKNIDIFKNEEVIYNRVLMLQSSPYTTLFLFLFFLPNLALKIKSAVAGAAQTWSVGVEEQFYIIWPHLFNLIKNKRKLLLIFILISLLPYSVKIAPTFIKPFLNSLFIYFPIHFMGIGAIGAYLIFNFNEKIKFIFKNNSLFILNSLFLTFVLFYPIKLFAFELFFGFLLLFQILFIINSKIHLPYLSKLIEKNGEISYGIYMYHPIIMFVFFAFINSFLDIQNIILYNIIIYFTIYIFTYFVSYYSYNLFEKKFILLKKKKYTLITNN